MVDSIVSVRMPSSLVQRLKELAGENHFLDVSEEVRSLIKARIRFYTEEGALETEEKKSEAAPKQDYRTENVVREELVKKLKKMIKELENGKN